MLIEDIQTWLWARHPIGVLRACKQVYGPEFTVSLVGGRTILIVSQPESVREMFKACPQAGNDELRPFLGERSLFMLKGEEHARERRQMHAMLNEAMARVDFDEVFDDLRASELRLGRPFDPFLVGRRATLIGMWQACFGQPIAKAMLTDMEKLFDATTAWAVYSHTGRIKDPRLNQLLDDVRAGVAISILDAAATDRRPQSLVDSWLKQDSGDRDQLIDEVCTLMAAGSEPVAAGLAWTLCLTLQDPAWLRKVLTALSCDGASNGAAQALLDMTVKEAIRFMPIIPVVDRVATASTTVAGHALNPGDRVAACSYLTHRSPAVFDEPDRFNPDRFLGRDYSPFQYYPFGGGVRRCIGAAVAGGVMRAGLASFLRSFTLTLEAGTPPKAKMRGVVMTPVAKIIPTAMHERGLAR